MLGISLLVIAILTYVLNLKKISLFIFTTFMLNGWCVLTDDVLGVKNFDMAVTFDYQLGGKINDNHYRKLMTPAASTSDAGYNYSVDWKDAWSPTNTSSDIPRWQYGDSYAAYSSDRFLTSASYLNFQSFTQRHPPLRFW